MLLLLLMMMMMMTMVCACRSNKQECPASIFVTGTSHENALVVQKVNTDHNCSVGKHYFSYPHVRCKLTEEAQSTNFNVSATEIAVYLRDKGLTACSIERHCQLTDALANQQYQFGYWKWGFYIFFRVFVLLLLIVNVKRVAATNLTISYQNHSVSALLMCSNTKRFRESSQQAE